MVADDDFSAFGELAARMADLASIPSRATRASSEAIRALIARQFAEGTDAYGNTWAPLADGQDSHLYRTGNLFRSIDVRPMAGAGVQITVGAEYGAYHQSGTSRMPARPILPDGPELPEEWERKILDELEEAFGREFDSW